MLRSVILLKKHVYDWQFLLLLCIFPAISLPLTSNLKSKEKGLRHFSFSDVFGLFQISGNVSPSENSQGTGLAILFAQDQLSNGGF